MKAQQEYPAWSLSDTECTTMTPSNDGRIDEELGNSVQESRLETLAFNNPISRILFSKTSTHHPADKNSADADDFKQQQQQQPVIHVPLLKSIRSSLSFTSYDSFSLENNYCNEDDNPPSSFVKHYIRFQVVIWYVGRPDEVLGKVEMKFRVTIFWNNPKETDENIGYGMNNPYHTKVWKMHGRQRAYETELSELGPTDRIVYVPPVSILNAVDFEVLGEPEVCQLNSEDSLMTWSCLYKANLLQDDMRVADFPHDIHDLVLRLGILKHRQRRKRWDQTKWKLSLATEAETQQTIEIPHGTIVDHVQVPGFSFNRNDGLEFQFLPLQFGRANHDDLASRDQCLQVKLRVTRESSYYDRNIVPLLTALNTVGICTLALNADQFGSRGEMILATAFVEIGIRMTVDSRLPVVGYQIKMQWVLNNFFFGLLFLVCESSIAYILLQRGYKSFILDRFAAIAEGLHMLLVLFVYFGRGETFGNSICGFFKRRIPLSTKKNALVRTPCENNRSIKV